MQRKLLDVSTVRLGQPLPWDLYNAQGRRIFRKGFIFHTETALLRFRGMVLYYSTESEEIVLLVEETRTSRRARYEFKNEQDAKQHLYAGDVFSFLDYCVFAERHICDHITAGSNSEREKIYALIENIELLYGKAEEVCLGAIHLEFEEHPYSCLHPVYAALLCLMMAKALGYTKDRRTSLIGAALTANLGMYSYHDEFVNKDTALSDAEWETLKTHPEISSRLLEVNKVTDELWCKIVWQSHERLNGTGYPKGLKEEQICHEARIYRIVDTYLAMVMPRAYRKPKLAKHAMKDLYEMAAAMHDTIAVGLIKQLGIYPPGTCVLLNCKQIAIVMERNRICALNPKVAIVADSKGNRIRPTRYVIASGDTHKIIDAVESDFVKGVDPSLLWENMKNIKLHFKAS